MILAASKTHPPARIRELHALGQRSFGENYIQEALAKQSRLEALDIEWHFIGPLQSNKTKGVAEAFDWVHSLDRLSLAQRLSRQRPPDRPPLNVCVQVNISGEASKSGVTVEALPELLAEAAVLPGLHLRGLMAIPKPQPEPRRQHEPFQRMRELFDTMNTRGYALDTLSMGMSGDLEAAIAAGATLVRVGTAIFGSRD